MVMVARRVADLEGREIMRVGEMLHTSQAALVGLFDVLEDPACALVRDGALTAIIARMQAVNTEREAAGLPRYR